MFLSHEVYSLTKEKIDNQCKKRIKDVLQENLIFTPN
jgi:hypothetical protein